MAGSFALILRNDDSEVLLVKRRDIPIWNLPGGHIEAGETPEEAATREVFEETGYNVDIVRKTAEYTYREGRVNHFFECYIKSGIKTLSNESKEIDFFPLQNLPKMIFPYTHVFIEDCLSKNPNVLVKQLHDLPISFWLRAMLHPWALFKYILTKMGIHWNT